MTRGGAFSDNQKRKPTSRRGRHNEAHANHTTAKMRWDCQLDNDQGQGPCPASEVADD